MDYLISILGSIFPYVVVVIFALLEFFALDREKVGVMSLLSATSWVLLCFTLHYFQFFPYLTIVIMVCELIVFFIVARLMIFFINKICKSRKAFFLYGMLMVLCFMLRLMFKVADAPPFILTGLDSISFTYFVLALLTYFITDSSDEKILHLDIVCISSLLINLFMLQCNGGTLVIFSDLNPFICVFIIILGVVGSIALYANNYSLMSLGLSVMLGFISGGLSTALFFS